MSWCLIPKFADEFKKKIVDGTIDPEKLSQMTSAERNKFFTGIVGKDNAKNVNSLFESKLLLKNQQTGMINWAKRVAGMTPEARRDIISRIEKMDKILDPTEEKAFLSDLASTKLGMDVTANEAKQITELSSNMTKLREAMDAGGDRLEYGRAYVKLENYVKDLKAKAGKISLQDFKENKINVISGIAEKIPSDIAGNAKAIQASMDNSAIFRQGWKTLMTNPGIWAKNAKKSFVDIWRTFGGKAVMDELRADIVSRPNYDLMKKAKLAIGTVEEAYPTALPEKIPLIGRAYKASENAFTAFVYRQRADVFDKYIEIAKKSSVNLGDSKELESIGKLVNSLTGRGNLGKLEPSADVFNNIFFSPRFFKSNIDTLTAHTGILGIGGDKMSTFARKQAAINLLKIVSGTAAILVIADAVKPGSVEWDPRSSDFGKIKIGNTRFDVTGGMGSIITLASRIIKKSTKSSTTGNITENNTGDYGAKDTSDLVWDFFKGKESPVYRLVMDIMDYRKGKTDFDGNEITPKSIAINTTVPMPYKNAYKTYKDPDSANKLVTLMADMLGISTNTYGQSPEQKQKSELNTLKDQISERNKRIKEQVQKGDYSEFNKLSDTDKKSIKAQITKEKTPGKSVEQQLEETKKRL